MLQGLAQLEREMALLGGMCAASLMRKDLVLPAVTAEEMEEDLDLVDEGAQQVRIQGQRVNAQGRVASLNPRAYNRLVPRGIQ